MTSKKLRIAIIGGPRLSPQECKDSLPNVFHLQSRNILEYHQAHGSKAPDAFAIFDVGSMGKDLASVINFIRSKPIYAKTPIGLFDPKSITLNTILKDPTVRFFQQTSSLSLAILSFLTTLQTSPDLNVTLSNEILEGEFKKALNEKLGKDTSLEAKPATMDETRLPYIAQKTDEISSNLLWIRLSARILEDGSALFSSGSKNLSEAEYLETCDNILTLVLVDFKKYILNDLTEAGAVLFAGSDQLSPQEKIPFIKSPKIQALLFRNKSVQILLEVIRYI